MKYLLFCTLFIFQFCNQNINMNSQKKFELEPLTSIKYEFTTDGNKNRIDYFFIDGNFLYKKEYYDEIEQQIRKYYPSEKKHLYSIYIYNKTDEINESFNKEREWLDGENNNLVAYIRLKEGVKDIFYILKEGSVVYDAIENKETDFEFDQ